MKINGARLVFYSCLIISIGLFVGGFFVPPMGVIDGSVLKAGGILLGFAALAIFGYSLEQGKVAKYSKGDIDIVIGDESK